MIIKKIKFYINQNEIEYKNNMNTNFMHSYHHIPTAIPAVQLELIIIENVYIINRLQHIKIF
jgi:hypothetical protein